MSSRPRTSDLVLDMASRARAANWPNQGWGFLPDPDPVLLKAGLEMNVYRQLLTDPHVWSCYQSRKSGTMCGEWEVIPSSPGQGHVDELAAAFARTQIEALDPYQLISDLLEALFFGFSPIEIVWTSLPALSRPDVAVPRGDGIRAGQWGVARAVGRPPEWFLFDLDNNLRFLSREQPFQGEPAPGRKFLLARHHASYLNPYGERLLARCFWPVTFKRGGLKFWAVFSEKYGMPWLVGKVPRGTNEAERDRILTDLEQMVQDAVAVINDDQSIELKEAPGRTASAEVFQRLIAVCNREISKAILGQTLSTELDQGGSLAAAQAHLAVKDDLIQQDRRLVATAVNQLLTWIIELNFHQARPPIFRFHEEEDIQRERAARDEILVRQGLRLSRDYYRRTYNLKETDLEPEADRGAEPDRGGSDSAEV